MQQEISVMVAHLITASSFSDELLKWSLFVGVIVKISVALFL